MNRAILFTLLAAGVAVITWRGTARASEREPASRVVCIEAAGVALRLLRAEGAEGALEAAGGCPVPLPPAGLPGEHLVSALLDDGSALELRRVPGEPALIGRSAREALERAGWAATPSSSLARGRAPGASFAELELPGGERRALIWVTGDGRDADPLLAVALTGEAAP
jgi:hypothetical protein